MKSMSRGRDDAIVGSNVRCLGNGVRDRAMTDTVVNVI